MPAVGQWRKAVDATGPSRGFLLKGIDSLYKTRDYSDLTIKCGSREWAVHKGIVCTQSTFFAKACKREWQKDASSGIITLEDEDEEVVDAMIDFFYLSNYDGATSLKKDNNFKPLRFSVKMFTAADKFDIQGLGVFALANFNFLIERCSSLEPQDFFSTIREVYTAAPSSAVDMRKQLVTKTICQPLVLFNKTSDNLASSPEFQKLIETIPSFGVEVVIALTAAMEEKRVEMEKLKRDFDGSYVCHCANCDMDFKVIGKCSVPDLCCPRCRKSAIRFWA